MSRSGRSRSRSAPAPLPRAPLSSAAAEAADALAAGPADPVRMERFALAAYALLAGALLLAGWAPDPRTWGLHALAFLPRVAWMAALLFCAALAAPRVAARFGAMVIATAGWVLGSWRRTATSNRW